jgi:hypothetical protein
MMRTRPKVASRYRSSCGQTSPSIRFSAARKRPSGVPWPMNNAMPLSDATALNDATAPHSRRALEAGPLARLTVRFTRQHGGEPVRVPG